MHQSDIVHSTVAYLEQGLARRETEALTLDHVAERIGYSKFYLNRLFRQQVGATIHQYLVQRRLTEAAEALVHTDRPVADIAHEAGYQSQQAFAGAFRNLYRCAPVEYRARGVYRPLRQPHSAVLRLHAGRGMGAAA